MKARFIALIGLLLLTSCKTTPPPDAVNWSEITVDVLSAEFRMDSMVPTPTEPLAVKFASLNRALRGRYPSLTRDPILISEDVGLIPFKGWTNEEGQITGQKARFPLIFFLEGYAGALDWNMTVRDDTIVITGPNKVLDATSL